MVTKQYAERNLYCKDCIEETNRYRTAQRCRDVSVYWCAWCSGRASMKNINKGVITYIWSKIRVTNSKQISK